nr:MAG TPA: hypothetical protein [Caudoviricetes sp.]
MHLLTSRYLTFTSQLFLILQRFCNWIETIFFKFIRFIFRQ